MNFTIKGTRTAREDVTGLCYTCRHAHITRGPRQSDEQVICTAVFGRSYQITHRITDCNSHMSKTVPALEDYQKIAWTFSVDDRRKTAGFLTPDKYKEMKKNSGDDDDDDGLVAPWDR